MKKNVRRILSAFFVVVILSAMVISVFAETGGGGFSDGITWVESGMSRADFYGAFGEGGVGVGHFSSKEAYDDYVDTLPATGYMSDGTLKIVIPVSYSFLRTKISVNDTVYLGCAHDDVHPQATDLPCSVSIDESTHACILHCSSGSSMLNSFEVVVSFFYSFNYPVSGFYRFGHTGISAHVLDQNFDTVKCGVNPYLSSENGVYYSAGDTFTFNLDVNVGSYRKYAEVTPPSEFFFFVIPDSFVSGGSSDTYNITTRPTSISGGNYGIVGDNGQITKVEDNSTIINETNNTYYNPATGTTTPITNWSYDYSDRSYKVTLESGDTATITYGDENITIQEGDTIYNVYYLVDGSENPPCSHEWTETGATPAACTLPGSVSYVCSKCQQEKTESIPALGHDWQVKQTVTTQYDDTGQLIQEGYTLFECSRCHEQYKSADGTIPPGGGSGTGPGGEDGETIWDKLGKLLGSLGEGALGLFEAIFGKLLDGLNSLAEMLVEKLKTVVETVLSIFDELPKLFGGFLDFLAAVFPFLPPELMTILTFGVAAVVFIAIIKAVRR